MEASENDLIAQRRRKLAELRALGVDPYPHRYAPTDTAAALHAVGAGLDHAALEALGRRARIADRIVALRTGGRRAQTVVAQEPSRVLLFAPDRFRTLVAGDERWNRSPRSQASDCATPSSGASCCVSSGAWTRPSACT